MLINKELRHLPSCKYDNGDLHMYKADTLKLQIMNDNFTVSEISDVIDSLKNKRRVTIWYQRSWLKTAYWSNFLY